MMNSSKVSNVGYRLSVILTVAIAILNTLSILTNILFQLIFDLMLSYGWSVNILGTMLLFLSVFTTALIPALILNVYLRDLNQTVKLMKIIIVIILVVGLILQPFTGIGNSVIDQVLLSLLWVITILRLRG